MRQIRFFILLIFTSIPLAFAQSDSITISEVMFSTSNTLDFIELYNYSKTQTIDLAKYIITDGAGNNDSDRISSAGEGLLLYPGQFAILLDPDYFLPPNASGRVYDISIPDTARIVTIDTNQTGGFVLGNGSFSNTTAETIHLIKVQSGIPRDTISRYTYSLGNNTSYSDEKITLNNDNNSSNWTNSIYLNGTPGAPPETNLSINDHRMIFTPPDPLTGASVTIGAIVTNKAIATSDSFRVLFYHDADKNGTADVSELLDSVSYNVSLPRNTSDTIFFTAPSIASGINYYIARIGSIYPYADTVLSDQSLRDSVQTTPAYNVSWSASSVFSPSSPATGDTVTYARAIYNAGIADITHFAAYLYIDQNHNGMIETDEKVDSANYNDSLPSGDSVVIYFTIPDVQRGKLHLLLDLPSDSLGPLPDEQPADNRTSDSANIRAAMSLTLTSASALKPSYNYIADTMAIKAVVHNNGSTSASGFSLILYHDANNNGLPDTNERVDSVRYTSSLDAAASDSITLHWLPTSEGNISLIVKLDSTTVQPLTDEDGSDNTHTLNALIYPRPDSITFSEIMFDPLGSEDSNEFIELYNFGTHAVDLLNWKIADSLGYDAIQDAGNGTVLQAGQYAIVFENEYTLNTGRYTSRIPSSALVLTINGSTFGSSSSGLVGTYPKQLFLVRSLGDTISTYRYSLDNTEGHSDTKINPSAANASVNWMNSLITDGTPGAHAEVNLSVLGQRLRFAPSEIPSGTQTVISVTVKDSGIAPVNIFKIAMYHDTNRNATPEPEEIIDSLVFSGQLYYGDSVIFTANTPTLSYGVHYFIARISQGEVSPYGDTLYYNDMLTDSIRTQPSGDIALNRGRLILGEIATRGNSFPIGAYAYNMGTQPVQSFTVRWYEDRDGNYTTAPEERIDSSTYAGNLLPGDSTFLQINYPNATYGKHRIMVEVISTSVQPIVDEEPSNNLLVDSLEAGARARDILISEFMYLAVTDSIPEWIEIYNPSALSISLMNWQLYDKTSHVVLTERSDTLHTGQFGIIVKDSTLFHKKYGEALSDVLYIYPTSMPSLNNTGGDIIKLSTPAGLTVDSLNYLTSWGDDEGISLERKLNDSASYSMSNWALSSDPSGGTPGTKNTATPQLHDLSITSRDILWTPAYPTQGEVFQIKATVRNLGVTSSGASAILLYAYSGADSTLLQTTNSPAILPGDSLVIVSSPITNGPQTYVGIQIDYAEDERLSNNFAKRFVPAATPRQTVIINEIMYKSGTGHTEWIELYNRSQNAVDLRSWHISDGNADLTAPATAKTITVQSVILQPDSFIIIAKDSVQFSSQYGTPLHAVYLSSMPALNDPGDMITIQDSLGSIVDSLVYLSGWGGSSDRTLERRFYDSVSYLTSNWLSCESPIGATPGHPNSVKPLHYDISLNASPLHVTPSYPRIGEPFTITAPIYNQGLEPVNDASLRWLRIRPQHDTLILSEQIIGMLNAGDSLKTSYSDTARQIGDSIVALILSVSDERTLNNKSAVPLITSARRNALVINEIMYDPGSNRPEWIELYNPGADTVDLKNWRLADESTIANPKTFAGTSLRIPSQHYVIITKDASALALSYPLLSSPVVTMTSFPTLNQTGDLILLTDSLSVTVDSVFYENTWGGANGFSIERISATDDANSPNNWKTSEANAGATPGVMNSTTPVALDLSIRTNDVWFDPPFPSPGQPVQIHMRIRNKGLQSITNSAVVRVYNDVNNDSIPQITEIIDSTTVPVLLAGDSQSVTIQWTIPASASRRLSKAVSMGSRKIIIQLDFASDERTENNLLFTALPLGTPFQSILINEFMYETDTSRTEFIELYNPGTTAWDLKDWKIADGSSVVSIADVSVSFLSGAYKVLAPDSSFFRKFSTTPASSVIIVPGLPSLNNTGDAIRLADDLGATVDSLTYSNTWGGSKNISVERIDADVSSDEPNNWTTSLTAQGHTAGSVNSIVSAEPFVKQSLIINEIMFSPLSGEPEYIELYNRSETAISLLNWAITVSDDKTLLAQTDISVPPHAYVVIAGTKTFPDRYDLDKAQVIVPVTNLAALPANGTALVLRDWVGTTIDSLAYTELWGGGDGYALERIQPDAASDLMTSWRTCVFVEGGTPGKINSVYNGDKPKKIRITADPNPFLTDVAENTTITLEMPVTYARVTMKIYDSQGRLMITLLNNQPTGAHREVIWDGRDKNGQRVRMGIYIIFIEAIEESGGFNKTAKQTIVVGKRL